MKKLLLFTVIAVFGFTVNSQSVTFGVKAGVNFSNWGGDADTDGIVGFYAGGLADITISEAFHVQPELLYSGEGGEDAEISFLRIPVMAKYYVINGLSIQAGPNFGFKVGADDFVDDFTKGFDVGLGLGAGYELANGLMFDARYNIGLTDISDYDDGELKTGYFQFGLGYRF